MESSSEQVETREELRKRLRAKIKEKRGGSSLQDFAKNAKNDPKTTLMSMGIDDPSILNQAENMFKNPHQALNNLKNRIVEEEIKEEDDEEDEEMPPEQI
tara:strand:+ start:57 stop:356 length:300 start_codon:yes stop_codon:yes gene_type:complete